MKRHDLALAVNLVIPGSGLIILRRDWLGLAISALFTTFAQIVIFGTLIIPLDVIPWTVVAAVAGLVLVWLLAQWLVIARRRLIVSEAIDEELRHLRARAGEAMARDDLSEAHRTLLLGLSVNDEDVESALLWAELMGRMGRPREARQWWKRVLALDPDERHRETATKALAATAR